MLHCVLSQGLGQSPRELPGASNMSPTRTLDSPNTHPHMLTQACLHAHMYAQTHTCISPRVPYFRIHRSTHHPTIQTKSIGVSLDSSRFLILRIPAAFHVKYILNFNTSRYIPLCCSRPVTAIDSSEFYKTIFTVLLASTDVC